MSPRGESVTSFYNIFFLCCPTIKIVDLHRLCFSSYFSRLERGELKPRVRAMEVERMIERNKLVQANTFSAVLSCLFLNSAVCLATLGQNLFGAKSLTKAFFVAAIVFGLRVPYGVFVKLRKLDEYNERFGVSTR